MAWIRNFLVLSVALSAGGVGCGDDDGGDRPDAASIADANNADAAPGGAVTGQILALEASINGVPEAGDGAIIQIAFTPAADAVAPSYEQNPGSPFACKVFERTPAQFAYVGVDEGSIQLSIDGGLEFPPCNYLEGEGYRCISVMGSGGDITAAGGPQYQLTNAAVDFGTDEVGRYVQIMGADDASNNGAFPIVAADAHSITYINPGGVADDATAAGYRILAGFGPSGQDDPIADDAELMVDLTSGGEGDIDSFSVLADDFGDAFTLDTASQALISDVPTDGSEFTLSCGGAGGDCGTALASGVNLVTTDGSIEGLPPGALPPPTTKSVLVSCVFLSPDVVIPAEASAYIMNSGATRIQTNYVRVNPTAAANGALNVIAGHAVAGLTDP